MKHWSMRSLFCLAQRQLVAFFLLLISSNLLTAATNNPPIITTQPVGTNASVGQDFTFTVSATDSAPLQYQWFFESSSLDGATNATLLLHNLRVASSGSYFARVSSTNGIVDSTNALLIVTPRRLATGRIVTSGTKAAVPIIFRAGGLNETNVSFSLNYSTAVFSNPTFVLASSNFPPIVTTNMTNNATFVVNSSPGAVGISVILPAGQSFPIIPGWLGLIEFDLAPGTDPVTSQLAFSNNPFPIAAVDSNNVNLMVSAAVQPQFVFLTADPNLNFQSGLFEHKMIISNPGATTMSNIDIFALSLGLDSRLNPISFYNAQQTLNSYPNDDPILDVPCPCDCGLSLDATNSCDFTNYLSCGTAQSCALNFIGIPFSRTFAQINNLNPGVSNIATLQFYVSDHSTVPHPAYTLFLNDPISRIAPTNTTVLKVDARQTNGLFLVEFPTLTGRLYYIEYAPTIADLSTNARTVLPPISGTGSRVQWVDLGPPQTESPPQSVPFRAYQVRETQ